MNEKSTEYHPECRFCANPLSTVFVDLGMTPFSNDYLRPEKMHLAQPFYPLAPYLCERCFLVQLPQYEAPETIFSDYAYFSSYSTSWLAHSKDYAEKVIRRFALKSDHLVVELASNDGYLLQYFKEKGLPVLGVEPAKNVAEPALEKGIPTITEFFGVALAEKMARDGQRADLLIGNNVLAHVPDLNDFVEGMKVLLKPGGVITMEFPHLVRLMTEKQFDTIYHEHFSYFSLNTVEAVFASKGLRLFDVDELPTHGGSIRIYAAHADDADHGPTDRLKELKERERAFGIQNPDVYREFAREVNRIKRGIVALLIRLKDSDARIAGYGAAAKGNTLLNSCGIGTDFLDYVVDRNPHKQGLFLPGTRIPIRDPAVLREDKPEYVLILPWNLKKEIMEQLAYIREWGGKFIVPIPQAEVL